MGFGFGAFGYSPFGRMDWARAVLWDRVPQHHRLADKDGLFEGFLAAVGDPLEKLREKVAALPDLVDAQRIPTKDTSKTLLRLGAQSQQKGDLEQVGSDGTVDAFGQFSTVRGRFKPSDRGKELIISGSSVLGNNSSVFITSVLTPTKVITRPMLGADAGPLRWSMRRVVTPATDRVTVEIRGGDVTQITPGWKLTSKGVSFVVAARRQFRKRTKETRLLTDREGLDGTVDSQGLFTSPSMMLTQSDVGKRLSIRGSTFQKNNGIFEILSVVKNGPADFRAQLSYLHIRGENSNGGIVYALKTMSEAAQIVHLRTGISTSLLVTVVGTLVMVRLATNASGAATSTADDVAAAIQGHARAAALVTATVTGDGTGRAGEALQQGVPGTTLAQDTGPLTWALLPFPELDLEGTLVPQGIIEREGLDLTVVASASLASTVQVDAAIFAEKDVGKLITVRGSTLGNDGTHLISQVLTANQVVVRETLAVELTKMTWEIRIPSEVGDSTQGLITSPDLLPFLAQTYGLESDERESDRRRRDWVSQLPRWVDQKGRAQAYQIIGKISGFDVTVKALYRISQDLFNAIPNANAYELGDVGVGRAGVDGTLALGGNGKTRIVALTANFKKSDVGRQIRIQNAAVGGNNKLYTIETYISSTQVECRTVDSITLPDGNNGSMRWAVVRLYTDLPPLLPQYDEFNADKMEQLIDGLPPQTTNKFGVDKFCWESDWNSKIGVGGGGTITLTAVNQISPNIWDLTLTGDCDVVVGVGRWKFIDHGGRTYWVETVPSTTDGGATWHFQVIAAAAPTLGTATLEYVCEPQLICSYCGASKILAIIEAADIAQESGVAIEKVFQRVVDRLTKEATPAHVELVTMFRQNVVAGFKMKAQITTP